MKGREIIYEDVERCAAAQASDTRLDSRFHTSARELFVGLSVCGSWFPVDLLVIKWHLLLSDGLSISPK